MSVDLSGPMGVGVAAMGSLLAYGLTFVQLRRRFPLRWRTWASQFLVAGAGAVAVGRLRDIDPVLLASMPMMLLGVALLAGKGSVAVLLYDAKRETQMTEETRSARRRFGILLTACLVVGGVLYVALGPDS